MPWMMFQSLCVYVCVCMCACMCVYTHMYILVRLWEYISMQSFEKLFQCDHALQSNINSTSNSWTASLQSLLMCKNICWLRLQGHARCIIKENCVISHHGELHCLHTAKHLPKSNTKPCCIGLKTCYVCMHPWIILQYPSSHFNLI